jgi:hypothetical protein
MYILRIVDNKTLLDNMRRQTVFIILTISTFNQNPYQITHFLDNSAFGVRILNYIVMLKLH